MANYTNLPIYKDTYSLLLNIHQILPLIPRDARYTIAQDLRQKVMDIIILIYRANRTTNKIPVIQQMREALLQAQVYFRLLNDMRYISERKYLQFAEETSDLSKQMSGWEKSESRKGYNTPF